MLSGIGALAEKDLKNLGVSSVRDLLLYLPYRYEDYSVVRPIPSLRHDDTVTITGRVRKIESRASKNRKVTLTEAIIGNETGEIKVTWFNQPYLEKTLRAGFPLSVAGRVDSRFGGVRTIVSPVWEPAGDRVHTGRIVPVYGLTGTLTMRRLRGAIERALGVAEELVDVLPDEIRAEESFPALSTAIRNVHFPESRAELDAAIARLKFDELFLHQLMFARVRKERAVRPSVPIPTDASFLKAFVSSLPFPLTQAQRRSAWEIVQDCALDCPMNRLLEGDVGSGKTAVAAIAIAGVLRAGRSVAYLAPTEILASQQHSALHRFFKSISQKPQPRALGLSAGLASEIPTPGVGISGGFGLEFGVDVGIRVERDLGTTPTPGVGVEVGLLTASQARIGDELVSRKELLSAVADGRVRCLVGTHALLRQGIDLPDLSLVVVDEQHRFGVQQRKALLDRLPAPHLLSMTATPIPRSLALTIYGDLDLSVLDEMPKGRKPVVTRLVFDKERTAMWAQIIAEIGFGRQAFVVCPLIDPSDALGAKSVAEVSAMLKRTLPRTVRVGILHGKLPSDEKASMIASFRDGAVDLLVSTTVVEVGVDIPNATMMVIVGAERFGLSQLHQLRGRVGRSDIASTCYLAPDGWSPDAKERLTAMTRTTNGFELAEIDLKLRGAGNVFGSSQSGFPDFKLATPADVPLMKKTRDTASRILAVDPDLDGHPLLREFVEKSLDDVHLE